MIDISKFQPFIYPVLPEVSDMEFISNTRRACIEFCRRTQVWQQDLEPINIVSGQQVYAFELPIDSDLSNVIRVDVDDVQHYPLADKPEKSLSYFPCYTVNFETKQIVLGNVPQSNIANGLKIRVALKPTITSFTVPEILLNHYPEAISYGALGNLCSMVGRPFSDFNMAQQYKDDFRHAINSAASDASYGFSRATMNTVEAYI